MIYVYNESDNPVWSFIDKNAHFMRITTIENSKLGIDIMKKYLHVDDVDIKKFSEVNMKELRVFSYDSFSCYFNSKSGNPFLHPATGGNQYSNDLFLLTYKVPKGFKICKEKTNKFSILYTNNANGCLNIIGVAKPNNNPTFLLTLTNAWDPEVKNPTYITKHMITTKRNLNVVLSKTYTKEEAEASKYKLSIIGTNYSDHVSTSRLTHPYSLIICPDDILEECVQKYHISAEHSVHLVPDDPDLYNKLKKLYMDHYNAATFYIDKKSTEITPEDLKSEYSNFFRKINFVTADCKIKSL